MEDKERIFFSSLGKKIKAGFWMEGQAIYWQDVFAHFRPSARQSVDVKNGHHYYLPYLQSIQWVQIANTRVYRQTNTKMVADCICFICDAVFAKRKYSVDINRLRLQYFSFKQTFYFILRKKNAKLAFNFSDSYQHQRYCYYSCNFRAYCKEGDSIVLLSSSHHPHHHRIYNDDLDFSQISEK